MRDTAEQGVPGLRSVVRLGWAADDDAELRLRKSTLTVAAVTITILSTIWVATFLALGRPIAAAIPALYQVASVIGLIALSRTRNFRAFRAVQLTLMLVLPMLLQWSVGGFVNASAVGIWSFVAGLGAVSSMALVGRSRGSSPSSASSARPGSSIRSWPRTLHRSRSSCGRRSSP